MRSVACSLSLTRVFSHISDALSCRSLIIARAIAFCLAGGSFGLSDGRMSNDAFSIVCYRRVASQHACDLFSVIFLFSG